MEKQHFYIDTCIWPNLFKKEGDATKGVPYWKIANDFIESVIYKDGSILVSTIVLKELYFQSPRMFKFIRSFFKESKYVKLVRTVPEDYVYSRDLEKKLQYRISFYDCLHIVIARRQKACLVTRDRALMNVAKQFLRVHRPEDLIG